MLTFGHDMAAVHRNSQLLWLPTQALHKINPLKNSSLEQRGYPKAPPLAEKLLAADGYQGGKSLLFPPGVC